MIKQKKLVLASGSPRRRNLLERLGFPCDVITSTIDEAALLKRGGKPPTLAERCALAKARNVAAGIGRKAVVLGADTIVAMNEVVFGKPDNRAEARQMLATLSGKWHTVVTGLAVIVVEENKEYIDHEITRVRMGPLDEALITAYLSTGEPMDKAGAYGIQGYGGVLVEKIEGCFFNVMGLPLFKLERMFEKCGLSLIPNNSSL